MSTDMLTPAKFLLCYVKPGPKPVWGELEIKLVQWIQKMQNKRMQVNQFSVIQQALELRPNFMGGVFDSGFIKWTPQWYHRLVARCQYKLSMQKPTSVGQKLPEG